MADAWEDKLADAIVAELNATGRGWAALFAAEETVAERTRKPWHKTEEMATLKVDVVADEIKRTRIAKPRCPSGRQFVYQINIDLQRVVDPTDDTLLKSLSYNAELMHDFFDDGHALTITGAIGWICLEARRPFSFSLPRLYDEGVWETYIEINVQGHRT